MIHQLRGVRNSITNSRLHTFAGCIALLSLPVACTLQASDDESQENAIESGTIAHASSALTYADLPFPLDQLPVEIKSVGSGKCLDIAGAGTANGSNAQQFTCNGGTNQTFFLSRSATGAYQIRTGHVGNKNLNVAGGSVANNANVDISDVVNDGQIFGFVKMSDGSYEIALRKSGKCLDVANASSANGANVQQFTCTGASNQRWILTARPRGVNLIAKHSQRCVDVASASTADNANVQQYDCFDATNQRWSIGSTTVVSGVSYFTLVAAHSGRCMDVADASSANNANVQQYACNNGANQQWQVIEQSDGYVQLKNRQSGKCLDVAGASAGNNANIQQFTCGSGDNQRFYWSIFESRHVQVVQLATSAGANRLVQSDAAVAAQVARANGVYGRYGLRLSYDPAADKSDVNSDALFNLGSSAVFSCPDGTTATPDVCAQNFANANWPGKVVLFSRPGNGFSSGNSSFIAIGALGGNSSFVCGNVLDTTWVTHEFGHYLGLGHTFLGDGDLLSDTLPDPGLDSCLAPHSATGTAPDGSTVATNNPLSYYYNDNMVITPMQASLARAGAFARGY